jgi:hypothetical protein
MPVTVFLAKQLLQAAAATTAAAGHLPLDSADECKPTADADIGVWWMPCTRQGCAWC